MCAGDGSGCSQGRRVRLPDRVRFSSGFTRFRVSSGKAAEPDAEFCWSESREIESGIDISDTSGNGDHEGTYRWIQDRVVARIGHELSCRSCGCKAASQGPEMCSTWLSIRNPTERSSIGLSGTSDTTGFRTTSGSGFYGRAIRERRVFHATGCTSDRITIHTKQLLYILIYSV